jgi:hypothetical protein
MGRLKRRMFVAVVTVVMPAMVMAADYEPLPAEQASIAPAAPQLQGPLVGLFGGRQFWQGSFGIAGRTPVVQVQGSAVSYLGADRQPYAVTDVRMTRAQLTFQVGEIQVSLSRLPDDTVELVSTRGDNASPAIVLCKAGSPGCL